MNYPIDKTSSEAAYMQLYNFLVEDIVQGTYPYASKLPSKRVIASDTGLSVITVDHALSLLCEEGYIESRERSGCFVIYKDSDFMAHSSYRTAIAEHDTAATIDRTHQPADLFPFTVLSRTMRKVLLDYGEEILVKSPNMGCLPLKKAIASYLDRSRGIHVTPGQIIIGSGAEYLYGIIAQLLGPGTFALEDPSYPKIRQVYESFGITCDMLKLRKNGISTECLNHTEASLLHVTPFHSYPSGISIGISKKLEYLDWAGREGRVIVEDNYDSELTVSSKPEAPLFSMADDRVIYMNTFSHTIAPSMRIGYMVLPGNYLEQYEQKLGFYSCTVPLFEQYVIAELLNSGDYERHINRIRRKKRRQG